MRVQVGKFVLLVLFAVSSLPTLAFGQLTVGGGWTHMTGNNGLDGLNAEVGYLFSRRITLLGQADFLWDNSKVSAFDLVPSTGAIRIKSNEQNYMGGGRVSLTGWGPTKGLERKRLVPFMELMFGLSHLHQSVKDTQGTISAEAGDNAFTWLIGGGVTYRLAPRWRARGNIDFTRTHFVDEGQSRARFGIALLYSF